MREATYEEICAAQDARTIIRYADAHKLRSKVRRVTWRGLWPESQLDEQGKPLVGFYSDGKTLVYIAL